ncbi:hypothetical protein ACFQX6_67275 [Streptosporangium lutulentum]
MAARSRAPPIAFLQERTLPLGADAVRDCHDRLDQRLTTTVITEMIPPKN